MKEAVGKKMYHRFHIIPRTSAERFYEVVRLADVLLHPFPFDGSRLKYYYYNYIFYVFSSVEF